MCDMIIILCDVLLTETTFKIVCCTQLLVLSSIYNYVGRFIEFNFFYCLEKFLRKLQTLFSGWCDFLFFFQHGKYFRFFSFLFLWWCNCVFPVLFFSWPHEFYSMCVWLVYACCARTVNIFFHL